MTSKGLKQVVGEQIKRFSGLHVQWLSFPEQLESRFEAETSTRRCSRLWLEGILALVLFDLFLIADHLASPEHFMQALIVRLGVVTPLAMIVNVSMLRRPNPVFRESSIAIVACVAGLTQLYLARDQTAVESAYAQFAILAVLLFANNLLRLRFPYALAASAVMMTGDLLFLYADPLLRRDQKIIGLSLTLSALATSVIANYSANREERLNYLLCLEGDVLVADLNRHNEALAVQAQSDALTQLANRHAFDNRFCEYWKNAFAHGTLLSVIIVDVDHFKRLNDTYGHLYGDKMLRRIARLIQEALRLKGDFAARYGGEEFVVLLPETSLSHAMNVAERLRKLVEVAGFPATDTVTDILREITATVSCGVATARPMQPDGWQALLDAADQALYEAKAHGRNRVCSRTFISEPAHAVEVAH